MGNVLVPGGIFANGIVAGKKGLCVLGETILKIFRRGGDKATTVTVSQQKISIGVPYGTYHNVTTFKGTTTVCRSTGHPAKKSSFG